MTEDVAVLAPSTAAAPESSGTGELPEDILFQPAPTPQYSPKGDDPDGKDTKNPDEIPLENDSPQAENSEESGLDSSENSSKLEGNSHNDAFPQEVTKLTIAANKSEGKVSSSLNSPARHPEMPINESKIAERAQHTQPRVVQNIPSSSSQLGSPGLLSLPIDSLHAVASFLSARDWSALGECCKGSHRVCREIFRRVRMHGFRCATEVVTAWKLGQHADARELCALYIDSGVPIYPQSLGHSYHTLVWRMGIEDRETQRALETQERGGSVSGASASVREAVDRFFTERYEARLREGYSSSFTYLEEKSMFLMEADSEINPGNELVQTIRRQAAANAVRVLFRTPHHLAADDPVRASFVRSTTAGLSTPESANQPRRRFSNSYSESFLRSPKTSVNVHRHLLDQHLLGRPSVNDNDGRMTTAPVNLSADFFHPHFSLRQLSVRNAVNVPMGQSNLVSHDDHFSRNLVPAFTSPPRAFPGGQSLVHHNAQLGLPGGNGNIFENLAFHRDDASFVVDDSDSDSELPQMQPVGEAVFEPAGVTLVPDEHRIPPSNQRVNDSTFPPPSSFDILSSVELEVYSSLSFGSKTGYEKPDIRELRNHLTTRFGAYQRRLEALILHGDNAGFEECILDFWDEFLPQTANIHYYDRNTPVPRVSNLHKFLTKPCPKAIGIVQCEIERIKLNPKKKRVNMKERFFPKYEYRLFIRHSPPENSENSTPPRRDTVLMMAKNKGRKHVENSGTTQGKKGANNYYLYMPKQDDVDHHYKHVNDFELSNNPAPNGASVSSPCRDSSVLLGRLQSNFIGTEFQIFTPQVRKPGNARTISRSSTTPVAQNTLSSDDEFGYDSGVSSDNASSSSRRRGRFGRLSLRRNSTESTILEGQSAESNRPPKRSLRRSRSSGDITHGRTGRTSRRAIANTAETSETQRLVLCEEEDGAITYTANLLGSRPRIMDVCIPKVSPEGVAGAEWKKYLEVCNQNDDSANSRMLNHLKQIQSRMENDDQARVPETVGNPEAAGGENGDYSPPEDFGLLALQNRPPWWNIELGSFVLNFGGRVSVASVKNFQLCDRNDQDYIMLQFGRIHGRHSFTMDFQHPLTAVQAFAIAISSLQSKISLS